ncbi:hypothetical protein DKT77_12045 [Meridianimarinicoccus roseus]|uniref:Uncharacterized protein n=1 Tax=Meridianimarinicoccus roseus TaxID=2072018 RepID=A0A2V2LA07_9RHOB|nr:hypothetical protein [Meridianimarinicoccus roseus]PWR02280.1 hypothetical protein DKT77_12045 [Meridianimarinicoccus roseus]
MTTTFYKGVKKFHVTGSASPIHRSTGIRTGGLDVTLRNSFGGATANASAATSRKKSAADSTGIGQCLTGEKDYAIDYIKSSFRNEGVLLVIRLDDGWLSHIVASAARPDVPFASMRDAANAQECTVMRTVRPYMIFFARSDFTDTNESVAPISMFGNGTGMTFAAREDWSDYETDTW